MRRGGEPIERRWKDARPRGAFDEGPIDQGPIDQGPIDNLAIDDGIGALLRRLPDGAPLPPAALARVKRRLARSLVAWPRLRGLRWVVAAAVLGTAGVVVAHRQIAAWIAPAPPPEPPAAVRPIARRAHPGGLGQGSPRVVAPPPAPAPSELPPAPPTVAAPRPSPPRPAPAPASDHPVARHPLVAAAVPVRPSTPPPVRSSVVPDPVVVAAVEPLPSRIGGLGRPAVEERAPPAPPGLGTEAMLVRRALENLRHDGDPAAALADLDEHRARFPTGVLGPDAELLRVDALLALGRRVEALALLQSLPIDASPRAAELRITRGELRAATDCARALADFDQALAQPLSDRLSERALRGRGACRVQRGDGAGAQRDLTTYLTRFPEGAFAGQARAWLASRRATR